MIGKQSLLTFFDYKRREIMMDLGNFVGFASVAIFFVFVMKQINDDIKRKEN